MNALTGCLGFFLILILLVYAWPLLLILALIVLVYQIYAVIYFKGEKFGAIKETIQNHIRDCNDLNDHIEELKNTALVVNRIDYGEAAYHDNSRWNVKRDALKKRVYAPYIYECSRTVCDNARKEPFKYICKYFGIKADEETLGKFETALNDFSAAEDGKVALKAERAAILESISADIPWAIKKFSQKKLEKNLGFEEVDFSTLYFPKYEFKYTSAGGNTGTTYDIVMDIDNLKPLCCLFVREDQVQQERGRSAGAYDQQAAPTYQGTRSLYLQTLRRIYCGRAAPAAGNRPHCAGIQGGLDDRGQSADALLAMQPE